MIQTDLDPLGCPVPPWFGDRVTEIAVSAARRSGEIQMQHFRHCAQPCSRDLHDLKIDTDRRSEEAIIEAIHKAFPDHGILTEESGEMPGAGEYTWIVDPLDGTVNFWHGVPFFCVSIACYRNGFCAAEAGSPRSRPCGTPVAGVVFLPFSGEMFVGKARRGSFLNGQPIRVRPGDRLSDVLVTVSFGKTPDTMQRMGRRLSLLLPRVRKARCLGAVAAELAYIAAGFLGGLVYEGIKLWDFAAGKILLEEAGGFLEAEEMEMDQWRVLAGTPLIRDSLKETLGS